MIKLIAILILSSNLSVAVETDTGWSEQSFPNSPEGAEQLMDYAENAVGDAPDGIRLVVGWLNDEDDDRHIIGLLADAGVKHGLADPAVVRAAATKNQLPETSPVAVALADIERFGFIYKRKPAKSSPSAY